MKKFVCLVCIFILSLYIVSCSTITSDKSDIITSYADLNNLITSVENTNTNTTFNLQIITTEPTSENLNAQGGDGAECIKHIFGYHETPIDTYKIFTVDEINSIRTKISSGDYKKDACGKYNTYMLITDYSIQREQFEKACYKDGDLIDIYTPERIDALYSGDMAKINEAFYDPFCAIYHDGEIYDINWILSHDSEKIINIGIPLDKIKPMVIRLTEFPAFTYNMEKWVRDTSAEDLKTLGFNGEDMDKIINGIIKTNESLNRNTDVIVNKLIKE